MTEVQPKMHVLIVNLPISDKILALGPGVEIKKLNNELTVFNLAALGVCGFREWAILEPITNLCLSEITSAQIIDSNSSYDTLNRAWLASSLLGLIGYTRQIGVACSAFSWDEAENIRKTKNSLKPKFIGGILDFHITNFCTSNSKHSLESADSIWVSENFEKFNSLASRSIRFRFALEAATDWRFSKDPRAAISRIWAGIESILELKTETVYRLSVTASSLLYKRGQDRLKKYKEIKKLYDARSKAVHGGDLKEDVLQNTIDSSFELLRKLLLLCIEKGKELDTEDFENAIFC